jgi:hypothetical protein
MSELLNNYENLSFGTEVIVTKKRYRLSEKGKVFLTEKYGHCLSYSQYEKEKEEFEEKCPCPNPENIFLGIKLTEDMVEVLDIVEMPCVILKKQKFGYHVYAQERCNPNITVCKKEFFPFIYITEKNIGREWNVENSSYFHWNGDYYLSNLNEKKEK